MRPIALLALAASLVACIDLSPKPPQSQSTASSSKTSLDPTAPQCPDSNPTCLTAPDCTYDSSRQCTVCRCSSPFGPPPENGAAPPIQ